MTNPCPGYSISTPYLRRGPHWSCDPDSHGDGVHTGVDYAAPAGTKVVAARPGTAVHSHHGAGFGDHQVDVLAADGTRDFYAHMRSRVPDGTHVDTGDKIGEVGAEGNVTGAHLHFERHATHHGGWSCTVHRDPAPSISYGAPDWRASGDVYVSKLHKGQKDSDSVARLRYRLRHHDGIPDDVQPDNGDDYGGYTQEAVRYWQRYVNGAGDAGDPAPGPTDGTSLSNAQAHRLFGGQYRVIEK